MIIYKCIVSNDEMFSDIYKITSSSSGIFYEVEGKTVTRTDEFDDALIGANASAEEPTETQDASCVSGCDIVLNHHLQETYFNKKSYRLYLKDYLKAVKKNVEDRSPEKVDDFMEKCKAEVAKIFEDWDNYRFYTGMSMNPDGMVGLLNFRDDGITPYMLFFKDGLLAEKC
ncbi:translationally-controlled tumor protein [Xyrichtys novacula]|uniref:Translationally-controlled tumor protein homolog n=1 Tax=Xyrichtys novacula TaxID=13765 RepID=A0AAV1H6Q7_XYRNO|nr:translationally-controlled tumor protein [Xyrichtys novacula]